MAIPNPKSWKEVEWHQYDPIVYNTRPPKRKYTTKPSSPPILNKESKIQNINQETYDMYNNTNDIVRYDMYNNILYNNTNDDSTGPEKGTFESYFTQYEYNDPGTRASYKRRFNLNPDNIDLPSPYSAQCESIQDDIDKELKMWQEEKQKRRDREISKLDNYMNREKKKKEEKEKQKRDREIRMLSNDINRELRIERVEKNKEDDDYIHNMYNNTNDYYDDRAQFDPYNIDFKGPVEKWSKSPRYTNKYDGIIDEIHCVGTFSADQDNNDKDNCNIITNDTQTLYVQAIEKKLRDIKQENESLQMRIDQEEKNEDLYKEKVNNDDDDDDDDNIEEEEGKCIICCVNDINVAFVPCGHMTTCDVCSKQILKQGCPICRSPIAQTLKIFK